MAFAKATWRFRREPFRNFQQRVMEEVSRRKREKMEQKTKQEDESNEQENPTKRREPVDFIDLFLEAESEESIVQNGNCQGTFQRAETKVGIWKLIMAVLLWS